MQRKNCFKSTGSKANIRHNFFTLCYYASKHNSNVSVATAKILFIDTRPILFFTGF